MMLLTVLNGRISCILEARMTAAAAAKLMIDLSAGRNGRPSGGKSARGVKWEVSSLGCDLKVLWF